MRGISPFVIGDLAGFTPQIARLVSMMNYVRLTTLETVRGLSVEQLDHLHDEKSNSIGALLSHVGAIETAYQAATFERRELNPQELERWGAALDLGARARQEIRGRSLKQYTDALAEVRARTLEGLAARRDDWLYEETSFLDGYRANNYFKWFHVFEDELNHRGQMRWLRKRLPSP